MDPYWNSGKDEMNDFDDLNDPLESNSSAGNELSGLNGEPIFFKLLFVAFLFYFNLKLKKSLPSINFDTMKI